MKISHKIAFSLALVLGGALAASPTQAYKVAVSSQSQLSEIAANPNAFAPNFDALGNAFDNREKLYWFTDFERAKAQAKLDGKPILSLRLLGNLSDEFSCANSRFFRVLFYNDPQIAQILRENFVLHWSSERPVPVVTIDMGDGRKIKRTLTGNSAHYLRASSGEVLDVLPGLMPPADFKSWLQRAISLETQWKRAPAPAQVLADFHRQNLEKILVQQPTRRARVITASSTADDLKRRVENAIRFNVLVTNELGEPIPAEVAAPLAWGKAAIEIPILNGTRPSSESRIAARTVEASARLAPAKTAPVLDENALARIREMQPTGEDFTRLIENLSDNLVNEHNSNQTRMLAPIHAWFADGKSTDFEELNARIYERLFLTPASDAWLGLVMPDNFTGLRNGGIVQTASPHNDSRH